MDSRIPNNDVVENNVAYVDSIPIAAKYHAGISPQSLTLVKRKKKRRKKKKKGREKEKKEEEEEDKAEIKREKKRKETGTGCSSTIGAVLEDEGIKPFFFLFFFLNVRALYRLSLSPPLTKGKKSRYSNREREREAVSPRDR